MKKVLSLLIACMMVISLAACGSNGSAEPTLPSMSQAGENETTTVAAVQESSEDAEGSTSEAQAETTSEAPAETTTAAQVQPADYKYEPVFSATIEETVIADENDVKITATELSFDDYDAVLSLILENNSDKTLKFYSGTYSFSYNSINGYMMDDVYFSETLEPGTTLDSEISYDLDTLMMFGITEIAEIGIGFEVEDPDYKDQLVTGEVIIKTSADPGFDYSRDTFKEIMDSEEISDEFDVTVDYRASEKIFDLEGVQITNEYVFTDEDNGKLLCFEVENTSDVGINTEVRAVSVNGLIVEPGAYDYCFIAPGRRAVLGIATEDIIEEEYMDALGMDGIKNIGFTMLLEDDDYTDLGGSDVTVNFAGSDKFKFDGDSVYSDNNVSIQYALAMEDPSDYWDDTHLLLIVKNDNDFRISLDADTDGSVNGSDIYIGFYGIRIAPGATVLVDIELDEDDLEEIGVAFDEIEEVKIAFEISDDNYDTLDEPEVAINVK